MPRRSRPTVLTVVGARPQFVKAAPLGRALRRHVREVLVHTGQHYDREMSEAFFEDLGIPEPDHHLGIGGSSHGRMTGQMLAALEDLLLAERPDLVVVLGDTNSTLAGALAAAKLHIPVAHVEAGLRSGDMRMPEEINRLVTDSISDWFFCTEPSGVDNLLREGKATDAVFHVGHVMVDNLLYQRDQLAAAGQASPESEALKQQFPRYGVVTLHRPSNVDDEATLHGIAGALRDIAAELPLIFPVHPRTRGNLEKFGLDLGPNVHLIKPQGYMAFLNLWKDAALILTDSGGLQEETTALGVPCLTLRENTERPVTIDEGSNVLVGTDPARIREEAARVLAGQGKQGRRPALWDGKAAERIVAELDRLIQG